MTSMKDTKITMINQWVHVLKWVHRFTARQIAIAESRLIKLKLENKDLNDS